MIKMVRGYGPPPQDAGMDYAGYGVAARELEKVGFGAQQDDIVHELQRAGGDI